jgi:hypothetical protein
MASKTQEAKDAQGYTKKPQGRKPAAISFSDAELAELGL